MPKCFCALTDSILCSFIVTETPSLADVICFEPTTNACVLSFYDIINKDFFLQNSKLICLQYGIKLFALGQLLKVVHGGKIFSNVHSNQDSPRTEDHSYVGPSPNQYGPPV